MITTQRIDWESISSVPAPSQDLAPRVTDSATGPASTTAEVEAADIQRRISDLAKKFDGRTKVLLSQDRVDEAANASGEGDDDKGGPRQSVAPKHEDDMAAEHQQESWPEPMSADAFYGLAGDFVRLVLPETEADPQALLVVFLLGFGCMVGRKPFYQVESTRHGVNLFSVIVGDTSKARKGTATDRVIDILNRVDPDFMSARRVSGLSSGEGLIQAVRDPREEDVQIKDKNGPRGFERQVVDTGEPDKRLLVIESEFSSVLQQSGREGNTLSAVLRAAWDGTRLRVLARSNRDSCQEPHVAMVGNITFEELQRQLTTNDKANGFGNRILWCGARRSKRLPHGGRPLDKNKADALVSKLQSALTASQSIDRVRFNAEACRAWEGAYEVLTEGATGIFGSLTARAEAQVVRLATLYALLEESDTIRLAHLKAAQEVWAYCEDSVRCIFGDGLGDETADSIFRMLSNAPDGMTRTEINRAFHSTSRTPNWIVP